MMLEPRGRFGVEDLLLKQLSKLNSLIHKTNISLILFLTHVTIFLQLTFEDLSQKVREEETFNPLKFSEKLKDVKNTKRADMISQLDD